MKLVLALFFISFSFNVYGQNSSEDIKKPFKLPVGEDYMPNVLIIKFKSIYSAKKISINSKVVQSLVTNVVSINTVKQVFASSNEGAANEWGFERIVEVEYSSKLNIEQVINILLENSNIEYVEPRYIYHSNSVPNDPEYLNNNLPYLQQVHAPDAWGVSIGSITPIIIAIIDSGAQLDHEDLAANIYYNEADPIDGIDNDKDGYVDNYKGWDLVGQFRNNPVEDNDPSIFRRAASHGTYVSGLASAVTNNGKGVASIANNYAKLLIVKVAGDDFPENVIKGYEGIKYAADHGAKIINCSWGGSNNSLYAQDIINYAIAKDCLIVAAAGNGFLGRNGINKVDYPAAHPGVLGVASVSSFDQKSWFSNYGREVSLVAPGEGLTSTVFNSTYDYDFGTSFATPIVSSAAALVKAKFPSLSMQEVAERLKATVDNIDSNNPAYIGLLGKGRLNVYRALNEPLSYLNTKQSSIELLQNYPNPFDDTTTMSFQISSNGLTSLEIYSISGKLVKRLLNTYLSKGEYRLPVLLDDLEEGIYIYMLTHQSTVCAAKLQIIR